MIPCLNCQTPNRPEAKFCLACGRPLWPTAELTTWVAVAPAEPVSAEPQPPASEAIAIPGSDTPSVEEIPSAVPSLMPDEPIPAPAMADMPHVALSGSTFDVDGAVEPIDVEPDWPTAADAEPADEPPTAVPSVPTYADAREPLAAGVLVADRFVITAVIEDNATGRVYAAADQDACNQCGATNEPGEKFCGACGVELTGPAAVRLQESTEVPDLAPHAVQHGNLWYTVLSSRTPTPAAEPPQPETGWRFQVGQASHPGKLRDLDEDSIFTLTIHGVYESQIAPAVGLYIVADGIGGHQGGEVASKLAVQTLSRQILQHIVWPIVQGEEPLPETLDEQLRHAVQTASRQVYDLRRERVSDMGTTLTMALLYNDLALIANVGDSRTYVWGTDGLMQLTRDHSLIADLIAVGQEPPEAIYTYPQRNLIYRSLGDTPDLEVDVFSLELEPGFRLILCCDGVWEMIRNEGIEDVMLQEDHPQRAADKIVQWANDAGGEDNISVVVVNVEHM